MERRRRPNPCLGQPLARSRRQHLRLAISDVQLDEAPLEPLRALECLLAQDVVVLRRVLLPHLLRLLLPPQLRHPLGDLGLRILCVRGVLVVGQHLIRRQTLVQQVVQGLGQELAAEGLQVTAVLCRVLAALKQCAPAACAPEGLGAGAKVGDELAHSVRRTLATLGGGLPPGVARPWRPCQCHGLPRRRFALDPLEGEALGRLDRRRGLREA
mmetsp:Transcript_64813/g.193138  ORF Transcript_64813/g.193138 Transcript_64813/m.193138 type:complete len:213 (+) Transcript_64813:765-1403(+)